MAASCTNLQVAWLGERSNELGWLFDRVSHFRTLDSCSVNARVWELGIAALEEACRGGTERVIFACANRVSYPHAEILWLQRNYPEIPAALAMGSYWEGARRTGVGAMPHVAMPWHRWLDGWMDWLDASVPAWFEPCTSPMNYDATRELQAEPTEGVVIANCRATATGWKFAAEQVEATVRTLSARQAVEIPPATDVDWVLWDDSCQSTAGGLEDDRQALDLLGKLGTSYPRARIFCALTIPRFRDCLMLDALGVEQLLTKPNTGRALQRAIAEPLLKTVAQ